MSDRPELLSCPFCGDEARVLDEKIMGNHHARIRCFGCAVTTAIFVGLDFKRAEAMAAEAWNTRTDK